MDADTIRSIIENLKFVWDGAELEEKRNILRVLIKRIWINEDDVKIEWGF